MNGIKTNFRARLFGFAILSALLLGRMTVHAMEFPVVAKIPGKIEQEFAIWPETSLKRVFPASPAGTNAVKLLAARNGKISFQVCVRNRGMRGAPWQLVTCKLSGVDDLKSQVRVVGYIPVQHYTGGTAAEELDGFGYMPGLVPDPLFPTNSFKIGSEETRAFWITLEIPPTATPGIRTLKARLDLANGKQSVEVAVELEISFFTIKPRQDFTVTHWWSPEAISEFYGHKHFSIEWYSVVRSYLADMLDHGSDLVYVPIFYMRRAIIEDPAQLLIVTEPTPGKYAFDWSEVKRFVDTAKEIGFKKFEWTHLWIYWGVENPIRVYTRKNGEMKTLWTPDISGFSDTYVNFLRQFLPEFQRFLAQEGILEQSYFHLSDEPGGGPHIENYKRARQLLRDLAPWMKVMDALSNIEYGKQRLTDMPIPSVDAAQGYIDNRIPHWVYYCCGPTGPWLNRFQDTPLPKIRMSGWLFYRLGARGFLHWGYNYWFKMDSNALADPFNDSTANGVVNAGDPFEVYPGPNGPIDSIRWEVFGESLQDYAILQTAGIEPESEFLSDIQSYAKFPKREDWMMEKLRQILLHKYMPAVGKETKLNSISK